MKRLIIIAVCLALVLSGCQSNPKESPVRAKDVTHFLDLVMITAAPETEGTMPDVWDERLEKDRLTVTLQARVDSGDESAIAIYNIIPMDISEEEAAEIIHRLIGDRVLYATKESNYVGTRDELESRILYFKRKLSEGNDEYAERNIPYLEAQLAQAPVSRYEKEAALSFAPLELIRELEIYDLEWETYGEISGHKGTKTEYAENRKILTNAIDKASKNRGTIRGITDLGDGTEAFIEIHKDLDSMQESILFSRYSLEDLERTFRNEPIADLEIHISQEDAYKTALDFLQKTMDIFDMEKNEEMSYSDGTGHHIVFTRRIGGLQQSIGSSLKSYVDASYYAKWEQESIWISVDDQGVKRFMWISPSRLEKCVNANAALMDFQQIQLIARDQLLLQNVYLDPMLYGVEKDEVETREISIDRIVLGMMTIPLNGQADRYMIVPVWDFLGNEIVTFTSEYAAKESGWELNDKHQHLFQWDGCSYLTINAIDGTVIDRNQGY